MYCSQCGNQNPDTSKFCQGCGTRVAIEEQPAALPQPTPTPILQSTVPANQPTVESQPDLSRQDSVLPAAGAAELTCPNCQNQVEAGEAFCHSCGAGLSGSPAKQQPAIPAVPAVPRVPPSQTGKLVGAGAGRRFFAVLIDIILFGIAVFVLYKQFGAGGLVLDTGGLNIKSLTLDFDHWFLYYSTPYDFLYVLVPFLGGILYVIIFEGIFGWTIGKLILGLRVVKTDGRRAGFIAALLRFVFWIIDIFLIGLIMVLVTKSKQRLGDKVAGTVVAGLGAVKAIRRSTLNN